MLFLHFFYFIKRIRLNNGFLRSLISLHLFLLEYFFEFLTKPTRLLKFIFVEGGMLTMLGHTRLSAMFFSESLTALKEHLVAANEWFLILVGKPTYL